MPKNHIVYILGNATEPGRGLFTELAVLHRIYDAVYRQHLFPFSPALVQLPLIGRVPGVELLEYSLELLRRLSLGGPMQVVLLPGESAGTQIEVEMCKRLGILLENNPKWLVDLIAG